MLRKIVRRVVLATLGIVVAGAVLLTLGPTVGRGDCQIAQRNITQSDDPTYADHHKLSRSGRSARTG